MEKKQLLDRIKGIIKKTYIELNDLSKEVEKEMLTEDNLMKKVDRIASDTAKIRQGVIR